MKPGVTAKDLFLHLAQTYGDHSNYNVEFGGEGLGDLSIDARRTLATMGTELNAEFSIFEPDDLLVEYIHERNPVGFEPQFPDADASYAQRRTIDLGTVETLVALPDAMIGNVVPVGKAIGERIDQAFIGSYANGNLEDIAVAARKSSPDVALLPACDC